MGICSTEIKRISSARPRLSVAAEVSRSPVSQAADPPRDGTLPALPALRDGTLPALPALRDGTLPVLPALRDGTLPVLPALRELLPRGGLARGSVVAVAEFGLLILALAAGASADGAWCGIAGVPEAGLLAAAGLGLDAERTLLVPHPGPAR